MDGGDTKYVWSATEKAKGEVVAYINAGDFYSKNAFDIVSSVFNKYVDVK